MNRTIWACALAVALGASASASFDFKKMLQARFPAKWDSRYATPTDRYVTGQIRLKLRPAASTKLTQATAGGTTVRARTVSASLPSGSTLARDLKIDGWSVWNVPVETDVQALAKQLSGRGDVLIAEPVSRVHVLLATPNDGDWDVPEPITSENYLIIDDAYTPDEFLRNWNMYGVGAPSGWAVYPNMWYTATTKPKDVPTISVIDSGCDMDHPDFMNAGGFSTDVAGGGQFIKKLSKRFQAGILDPALSSKDDNGHGTHVAGIALAAGNNGAYNGHGVIGTGYNCQGMIEGIIDATGNGTDTDAALAIYYSVKHGADVINCSFGGTDFSTLLQNAVTYATERGVTVVAAGNEANSPTAVMPPIYPAGCSGSVAVQAIDGTGSPAASYVGGGNYLDVAAPGGDIYTDTGSQLFFNYAELIFIWSTTPTYDFELLNNGSLYPAAQHDYSYLIGTSMASPHVAGAAGLWLSKGRKFWGSGYAPQAVQRALDYSADWGTSTSGSWDGGYGFGILDMSNLMSGTLGVKSDNVTPKSTAGGSIEGNVYANGIGLNSNVKAQRVGSSTSTTIATDTHGHYRFETLVPGTYTITFQTIVGNKSRKVVVVGGTETTNVNGWAWINPTTATDYDATPPTIGRLELAATPTATGMSLRQWAFDTETGVDKVQYRLGTTKGGSDIIPDTEVVVDGDTFNISAPISTSTVWVRLTATNGAGVTTTQDLPVYGTNPMRTITTNSTLQNWTLDAGGLLAEMQIRDTGGNEITKFNCPTRRIGENQFTTNAPGVLTVGARMGHWIRSVANTGATGNAILNLSLQNGDVNGDGTIDLIDFSRLSAAYGSTTASPTWDEAADLNGDGTVNLQDFSVLSSNYGKSNA